MKYLSRWKSEMQQEKRDAEEAVTSGWNERAERNRDELVQVVFRSGDLGEGGLQVSVSGESAS